jgi:hypothetical protein
MKTSITAGIGVVLFMSALLLFDPARVHSAVEPITDQFEYVTLRWGGKENTHVIRPSGNVEFLWSQFSKLKRPERADDRSFYMNTALNALAREGYELVSITSDDYILKRKRTN